MYASTDAQPAPPYDVPYDVLCPDAEEEKADESDIDTTYKVTQFLFSSLAPFFLISAYSRKFGHKS